MNQTASIQTRNDKAASRIEIAVLYGAFALIGAVVFGTLAISPF